jgi:FkbM family methyltransferase
MRLEPRLHNYGSTSLYVKRLEYEPTLKFLAACTRSGDTVVDVGANYGVYSLVLAGRVAPTGRVIAFEPGRSALSQLRRNLQRNPGLNVETVPLGLSDTIQARTLFHIGGPPTHSLSGFGHESTEPINVTTLDAWWSKAGIRTLDVVKADVEGHEPQVFRGGVTTLASHRPLVLFEVSVDALRRASATVEDAYCVLRSLGYDFFVLTEHNLRQAAHGATGNIFAVHPASDWPERLRASPGTLASERSHL